MVEFCIVAFLIYFFFFREKPKHRSSSGGGPTVTFSSDPQSGLLNFLDLEEAEAEGMLTSKRKSCGCVDFYRTAHSCKGNLFGTSFCEKCGEENCPSIF